MAYYYIIMWEKALDISSIFKLASKIAFCKKSRIKIKRGGGEKDDVGWYC